jgi:hypothetical protein
VVARVSRNASTDASNGPSVCQAASRSRMEAVPHYDPGGDGDAF